VRSVISDLRLALRGLRRRPVFAITAVITVALGIGATTAVFSVVRGVLLRDMPYEDPDRVVRVFGYYGTDRSDFGTISYPNFHDIRESASVFEDAAAYDEWSPVLTGNDEPVKLEGASVNAAFFRVLGVRPHLGRLFTPDEDAPGNARSVVVSHDFWRRRLAADSQAVGGTVELGGTAYTVVGVLPADFEDPSLSSGAYAAPDEIWRSTPTYFDALERSRSSRSFTALARLRPGVSLAAARADVEAIMARLVADYPDENENRTIHLVPVRDQKVAGARRPLWVLLGAAGFLLLLAAANVANLLLARASDRRREFAMRAALGAGRRRLVRQLLTESLALGLAGGTLGVGLAFAGTRALLVLGGDSVPRADQVGVDPAVLAFALVAMVVTAVLFGLAPASRAARTDVREALQDGERGSTGLGRPGMRTGLVVAEVGLAVLLLTGAGLLGKSFWKLMQVDPGFEPARVLTLEVDLVAVRALEPEELHQRHRALEERLAAVPGVEAAGFASILPMSGSFNGMGFDVVGYEPAPGERLSAETRAVTPGFFDALGIRMARGRGLSAEDAAGGAAVVVVNRTLAARYWENREAVGGRIRLDDREWEVVGVVNDVHQFGLDEAPRPAMYLSVAQAAAGMDWLVDDGWIVVRTATPPGALAAALREAIWSVDPTVPISDVVTMEGVLDATTLAPRFQTVLLGTFAAVALLLGAIGIYGVLSYAVTQRTRELGIRAALGGTAADLLRLVLAQGMLPVGLGLVIGVAGALALGRTLSGLLFETSPTDVPVLVSVALLLGLVALAACLVPARRGAGVDPMEALRVD